MNPQLLFWFRTRQAILEEWGYTPGLWHLVRRSALSIAVVGITAEGRPRCLPSGDLSEYPATRVALAILNAGECEFRGPFQRDRVPLPDEGRPASQVKRAA
jgi:hypothetical protein